MTRQWVVYMVRPDQPSDGPVKIGVTSDLQGRLREFQVFSPYRLVVEGTICATGAVSAHWMETSLHSELRRYRMRGEWFQDHPTVWQIWADYQESGLEWARTALLRARGYCVED